MVEAVASSEGLFARRRIEVEEPIDDFFFDPSYANMIGATRDGRHVLVSIWEEDGAVTVYDAASLEEVKRLPMKKPSGKYNIWNKITFSEGTSH